MSASTESLIILLDLSWIVRFMIFLEVLLMVLDEGVQGICDYGSAGNAGHVGGVQDPNCQLAGLTL